MDACFRDFFNNLQIALMRLSRTVFRPVLLHFKDTIEALGPLNAYSCRSNERSILKFKTLMTSKQSTQAQPSNLITQQATLTLFWHANDLQDDPTILRPPVYQSPWLEHPEDDGRQRQLWTPHENVRLSSQDAGHFQGISVRSIRRALEVFYTRHFSLSNYTIPGDICFELADRAWLDYKFIVTSTYYAIKENA
ncbi:hypothetical protein MBANPS3_008010 [Mucor bainieri]